ncbi:MAG: endonuclease/exonuclease/phosphatase family protein [Bacteroidales bacterium]|nr:endonuclease/exonuclease/phosphatase family protein [Bacteroidales bacterium]
MGKRKSGIIKILVIINILVIIPLLVSYFSAYISPAKNWYFAFFGLAYPIFLLCNVIFVVLWLITWKKYIFLSLISIFLGWNILHAAYPFHWPLKQAESGIKLKLISYNVNLFWGNNRTESISEIKDSISSFLLSQKADVICLQECYMKGPDYTETLKSYSRTIGMKYFYFKNYRNFWDKKKIDAIMIFSRFPIADTGYFKYPDKSAYAIFTDVIHHHDTIRIYNLHLESIRFGNDDYSFYSNLTDPMKEKPPLKEGTKKMFWKLRRAFILRAKEVDNLKNHIASCPYPVIIAGDFNDTPPSYTYHQLNENFNDAYVTAGNEFLGSTYAGRFPAFRIDYILYSDRFKAVKYKKMEIDLSDHYPISASFVYNP